MHLFDQCHKLLHLLGWSAAETAWRYPDGSGYWQVDASRGEQVILARGQTQGQAWASAVRMVGKLIHGVVGQRIRYTGWPTWDRFGC